MSKTGIPKTNAWRLAESAGIRLDIHACEVDEAHLDAVSLARRLGVDPDRVFKTLLAWDGASQFFVCILPGSLELNLKKAARSLGTRHLELAPLARLTELTGYIRGGCSPLCMKKPYPTYLDESAQLFETILVSAGQRGLQLELRPADLLELCARTGCNPAVLAELT